MKYFWAAETLDRYLILYMINKSNISIEVLKLYFILLSSELCVFISEFELHCSPERNILSRSLDIYNHALIPSNWLPLCAYDDGLKTSEDLRIQTKQNYEGHLQPRIFIYTVIFNQKYSFTPAHKISFKQNHHILIYAIKSLSDLSLIFCNIIFVWQLLLKYNWNINDPLFYQKLHQQLSKRKIMQALQQSS